jgi:hypothetical protein
MPGHEFLLEISQNGSLRLENWTEARKHPYDYWVNLDMKYEELIDNPLAVFALCGPAHLEYLLSLTLQEVGFEDTSSRDIAAGKLLEFLIDDLRYQTILKFLQHRLVSTANYDMTWVLRRLSQQWPMIETGPRQTRDEWTSVITAIFEDDQSEEVPEFVRDEAYKILCFAAESGCAPIVDRLFELNKGRDPPLDFFSADSQSTHRVPASTTKLGVAKAASQDDVMQARGDNVVRTSTTRGHAGSTIAEFGPIGLAAYNGHLKVLRKLLAEPGSEKLLKKHDLQGGNIISAVAERGNYGIIRLLAEKHPGAVNESVDEEVIGRLAIHNPEREHELHPTALQHIVLHAPNTRSTVDTITHLIKKRGGNLSAGNPDHPNELLEHAARWGRTQICKCLISVGHLDPNAIVGILNAEELCLNIKLAENIASAQTEKELLEAVKSLTERHPSGQGVDPKCQVLRLREDL